MFNLGFFIHHKLEFAVLVYVMLRQNSTCLLSKMTKLLHSFTPQALVWSEGFYHHCSLKKHNQPVFHVEDPNTQDWRPRLFLSTATIQHLHVFFKN